MVIGGYFHSFIDKDIYFLITYHIELLAALAGIFFIYIIHLQCLCVVDRFVHVGSAGVTRPDRPGLDLSKQPPAVRLNKDLGFILTYKLKVSNHLN